MAKEFAKSFYKSKAWKRCRESYIAKRIGVDGGICEKCRENPGYIVHHRIELSASNIMDPEIALNHSNLMYECKDCHDREEEHFVGQTITPHLRFDSEGQPYMPYPPKI